MSIGVDQNERLWSCNTLRSPYAVEQELRKILLDNVFHCMQSLPDIRTTRPVVAHTMQGAHHELQRFLSHDGSFVH